MHVAYLEFQGDFSSSEILFYLIWFARIPCRQAFVDCEADNCTNESAERSIEDEKGQHLASSTKGQPIFNRV